MSVETCEAVPGKMRLSQSDQICSLVRPLPPQKTHCPGPFGLVCDMVIANHLFRATALGAEILGAIEDRRPAYAFGVFRRGEFGAGFTAGGTHGEHGGSSNKSEEILLAGARAERY